MGVDDQATETFSIPPGSTMIQFHPMNEHKSTNGLKNGKLSIRPITPKLVRPRKEGEDDSSADVTLPTPGLPNLKSLRPVNKLRAAADEFSNVRNDLDEKLEEHWSFKG